MLNIDLNKDRKDYYNPQQEEEFSTLDILKASMNANIIGFDYLNRTTYAKVPDENFKLDNDDSKLMLNKYDIKPEDYSKYNDSVSLYDLEGMIKEEKRKDKDAEIAYGSLGGIGMSLAVSAFDPSAWIVGGVVGKAAQIATRGAMLTNTQARLIAGGVGLTEAIASDALLEKSLGNELTLSQSAINGVLGFSIGYGIGKGFLSDQIKEPIQNIKKNGIDIKAPDKESSNWFSNIFKSEPDKMKGSNNAFTRAIGHAFTRTMKNDTVQTEDTINDKLDEMKRDYNVKTITEFEEVFKKNFEAETNRKYTPEEEEILVGKMHEIQHKLSKDSDVYIKQQKQDIINEKILELDNNFARISEELRLNANKQDDVIDTDLKIKKPTKRQVEATEKRKAKALAKQQKEAEKEIKRLQSELDKSKKEINKGKFFTKEQELEFKKKSNEINMNKKDSYIDEIGAEYKEGIRIIQNGMFRKFADRIEKNAYDGYNALDKSFYFPSQYDINKIADDTDGAISAFQEAILDNYSEIDDAIIEQANKAARSIVDSLSNKITDSVEIQNLTTKELKRMLGKSGQSRLKGRKLKLDRSKLTKYMNNDIGLVMENYSREMSANLALKEKFNIGSKVIKDEDGNIIQYDADAFAKTNGMVGKDKEMFDNSVKAAKGLTRFDPRANTPSSKIVRAFNSVNFLNFGGWFGVNTVTDLANVVNDFGMARTMKYATGDLVSSIARDKSVGTRIARAIGYSAESMTNDRAILNGAEGMQQGRVNKIEKGLLTTTSKFSKITGLNMVVDFMDRVVSISSLDYILTRDINSIKFTKTMNRLGLTLDEVSELRKSGLAKFDNIGISDVDFNKINPELEARLNRALRRAIRDSIIRANDLDTPKWLGEIMGSQAIAKLLFQFLRFPVVAHNKLLTKMVNNFDAVDAMASVATATAILGLVAQMKDIGKEEKKYDLTTKDGQINTAKMVVERIPFLGVMAPLSTQIDLVGRMIAVAQGESFEGRNTPINLGVTLGRLNDVKKGLENTLSGNAGQREVFTAMSFATTNIYFLQPALNMVRDEIKSEFE